MACNSCTQENLNVEDSILPYQTKNSSLTVEGPASASLQKSAENAGSIYFFCVVILVLFHTLVDLVDRRIMFETVLSSLEFNLESKSLSLNMTDSKYVKWQASSKVCWSFVIWGDLLAS